MYIELHASSAFSFLDGASLPEALIERAAALGYPALALLDRDGVYGAPRFHLAAKKAGLKAIIGAELTMTADRGVPRAASRPDAHGPTSIFKLPVLIESRQGYKNLCRLLTRAKLRAPKGEGALTLDEIDGHTSGLIALGGRALVNGARFGVGGLVDRLVGVFGRAGTYLELQRHLLRDEESDNHALRDLASAFHVPVLATNGVRFATPLDRPLYDVLTCLRHKTTLAHAGRRLSCNAERYLKSPAQMGRLFADVPEALAAAGDLADRLAYTMGDLGYRFPEYPVPPGESMASFLRKIAQAGARERYRPIEPRHARQIERELDLIEKLDLAGYFLIVWDIVNFCRQERILVQGRGSAANSAVCYSLGITAVDPVGMDLLFERFLSEQRGEWPDIDLDLPSGDRRERVIQHIYDKYGKLGAAMTANVITYRGPSAARDVGKALSMEPDMIDRLAKVMNHFEFVDPSETLSRNLREAGMDGADPTIQRFGTLWRQIQDLPRHLGQHSGGMVICQGRLDEIVPLENASMPDRVVIQWDKDDCADMGIVKVDLLGLGMMAVLQDALEVVNREVGGGRSEVGGEQTEAPLRSFPPPTSDLPPPTSDLRPPTSHLPPPTSDLPPPSSDLPPPSSSLRPLDLAHLPPDDPAVYRMLQEADTIGIFQVESRAQMATLPRLRPTTFYDIVVEVAIIRPGPIVGQMVHPYLKRRQGQEPVRYPHPSLEPILARTLGVPLFQEQLLRIAMVAAGFSGGEAEELRRAFGFKRSERRMQQIEGKLRAGMERQGITGDAAAEIIRSITSFALYGFPESHAASFALLVYASAYLKAHYPAAFYAAMLNNQPMGFYHPSTLVKDAQRHGVRFAAIDVQVSDWLCRVQPDGRVRLGLMYVNGLRREVGEAIASWSEVGGRRSEIGGRRSEVGGRGSEVGGRRSEVGGRRSEVGGRGSEVGGRGSEVGGRRSEVGGRGSEVGTEETERRCPKCGCDNQSMLEMLHTHEGFCNICSHLWTLPVSVTSVASVSSLRPPTSDDRPPTSDDRPPTPAPRPRFETLDALIRRTGLRRDEVATLAEIGALNAFGFDRRTALWQVEQAVRPAGELFEERRNDPPASNLQPPTPNLQPPASPLKPMTVPERLLADYAGTSLTIGPHPMSLRRPELALRGVLRASDLSAGRHGRRVRVAGAVITRQRPGTAKGFVFLTLEDETGIANIIVRPDLFSEQRATIVGEPYLLVEGTLQIQEGVTSVKAERLHSLDGHAPRMDSHDFR